MKYVRQIGIILGITLAGEFLNKILPLPVPAGVYGLFLMLAALMTGVVKLESRRRNRQFPDGYHVYDVCTGNSRDPGVRR